MFSPVRTRYPFEEAVTQIIDAIRAGDLSPTDKLPSERALAEIMDISRPTLREAVKVLSEAGILAVRPGAGGGIFIQSDTIPPQLNHDGWTLRMREVADVLEARRVIQPKVAQFAAMRATDEDFEAMAVSLSLLKQSLRDRRKFMQLDERFQISLSRASHNSILLTQMKTILRQVRIARDSALREEQPADSLWALGSLQRIYDALKSRDLVLLDQEIGEHLAYLEDIWAEELGQSRAKLR